MEAKEILALINAGYTKSEIDAMAQDATKVEPQPEAKEKTYTFTEAQLSELLGAKEPDQGKTDEKKEPAAEPAPTTMSDAQFTQLMQSLRTKGAQIDLPPKREETAEGVLANRLTVMLTGKKPKEE